MKMHWTIGSAVVLGALVASSAVHAACDVKNGKALYDADCAKCHGKTGDGDGKLGRSLEHKPTNFNDKTKVAADDELTKSIRGGSKAIGKSGDMDGFPKYTDEQIADVIGYLKTLAK